MRCVMVRLGTSRAAARGAPILAPLVLVFACSEQTDFFGDDVSDGGSAGSASAGTGGAGSGGSGQAGSGAGAGAGGASAGSSGTGTGGAGSGGGGSGGKGEAAVGNEPNTGGTGNAGSGGTGATAGDAGEAGEFGVGGSGGDPGSSGDGGSAGAGSGEGGTSGSGGSAAGGTAGAGAGGVSGSGAAGSGGAGNAGAGAGGAGSGGKGGTAGTGGCTSNPERCDGVNNNCTGGVDEDNVCPTGCTGSTRDGHVYVLCNQTSSANQVTWSQAATRCAGTLSTAAGVTLELARIESSSENSFVLGWIQDRNLQGAGVWMGANDLDVSDSWAWGRGDARVVFFQDDSSGGHAVGNRYTDWGTGRPNGDEAMDPDESCGQFDPVYSWHWNDRPCENQPLPGYICEQKD